MIKTINVTAKTLATAFSFKAAILRRRLYAEMGEKKKLRTYVRANSHLAIPLNYYYHLLVEYYTQFGSLFYLSKIS